MNTIITIPQPPKRYNRAEIADCLQRILNNQQSIAHTFWGAFQSLGYRLDKHEITLEKVQARLWKAEHPARMKTMENDLTPEQKHLMERARTRFGEILPCSGKNWGECFMRLPGGELTFWFNSTDGGSHMERGTLVSPPRKGGETECLRT